MKIEKFRKARKLKDKNFDGIFYFAVKTTGVFCRPSCPAPIAKEKNVKYYDSIFTAMNEGFRPCHRCRPDIQTDYYKGNPAGSNIIKKALQLIYDGYLHEHSVPDLAEKLSLSERHLRKLFQDNIGISPSKIDRYNKILFAKKLLLHSNQSITDIAFASGFGSLRQFNDVFKASFNTTPSAIRKEIYLPGINQKDTSLEIKYTTPYDFLSILEFLKPRVLRGVEKITDSSYSRTFRTSNATGFFSIHNNIEKNCLQLSVHCSDLRCLMPVYNRVRKMFDVDTDFSSLNKRFANNPILSRGMHNNQIPRLPVAFDPFEVVIRAIIGQQLSVPAATTVTSRFAQETNILADSSFPDGLDYFFPLPEEVLNITLDGIGLTNTRQETIMKVVKAIIENKFELTADQSFETFRTNFTTLKGIGDWTAHYVAIWGLGLQDCYPYNDLRVIKALTLNGDRPTANTVKRAGMRWYPFRTYATLCLWNSLKED
jgi:AraC family transcriptional regulator, regulatory protein of adaptative response / DNA-3-methyladenine glycosylase II